MSKSKKLRSVDLLLLTTTAIVMGTTLVVPSPGQAQTVTDPIIIDTAGDFSNGDTVIVSGEAAVQISADNVNFSNNEAGDIRGEDNAAIIIDGASGVSIVNRGAISGDLIGGFVDAGDVIFANMGALIHSGSLGSFQLDNTNITLDNSAAIIAGADLFSSDGNSRVTLINSGFLFQVDDTDDGLFLGGFNEITVENSGLINTDDGVFIQDVAGDFRLTNTESGIIDGIVHVSLTGDAVIFNDGLVAAEDGEAQLQNAIEINGAASVDVHLGQMSRVEAASTAFDISDIGGSITISNAGFIGASAGAAAPLNTGLDLGLTSGDVMVDLSQTSRIEVESTGIRVADVDTTFSLTNAGVIEVLGSAGGVAIDILNIGGAVVIDLVGEASVVDSTSVAVRINDVDSLTLVNGGSIISAESGFFGDDNGIDIVNVDNTVSIELTESSRIEAADQGIEIDDIGSLHLTNAGLIRVSTGNSLFNSGVDVLGADGEVVIDLTATSVIEADGAGVVVGPANSINLTNAGFLGSVEGDVLDIGALLFADTDITVDLAVTSRIEAVSSGIEAGSDGDLAIRNAGFIGAVDGETLLDAIFLDTFGNAVVDLAVTSRLEAESGGVEGDVGGDLTIRNAGFIGAADGEAVFDAIDVVVDGDLTVNLSDTSRLESISEGVDVETIGSLTVTNAGFIGAPTGETLSDGIDVTVGGDVIIDLAVASRIEATSGGIEAGVGGDLTVTNAGFIGAVAGETLFDTIDVTVAGDVTVDLAATSRFEATSGGVEANVGGDLMISNAGFIGAADGEILEDAIEVNVDGNAYFDLVVSSRFEAGSDGIQADIGGDLIVNSAGFFGGADGVTLFDGIDVMVAGNASVDFAVTNRIEAVSDGIDIRVGGDLIFTNAGFIGGPEGTAAFDSIDAFVDGDATIDLTVTSRFEAVSDGVEADVGGDLTVHNAGFIGGAAGLPLADAIDVSAGGEILINLADTSRIEDVNLFGINVSSSASTTINNAGLIAVEDSFDPLATVAPAIQPRNFLAASAAVSVIESETVTLSNSGSITAAGASSIGGSLLVGVGVNAVETFNLDNSGEISSELGNAIEVLNQGGSSSPVATVIMNLGRISGGMDAHAILVEAGDTTITNRGEIIGHTTLADGNDAFHNFGTLTGNVNLAGGDDVFTFGDGAITANNVDGGAGTDLFRLSVAEGNELNGNDGFFARFSNFEDVVKTGDGTLNYTSNRSFDSFAIEAGLVVIDGVLTGDVFVGADAVLGGSGLINGPVVVSGLLNAGNSPGTLTIDGSLTLDAMSVFEVEFNVAAADLVSVTGAPGSAFIEDGATLLVTPDGDNIFGTFSHEVLATQGGITGDFATVFAPDFVEVTRRFEGNSLFLEFIVEVGNGMALDAGNVETASALNASLANSPSAAFTSFGLGLLNLDEVRLNETLASLSPQAYGASLGLSSSATLSVVDALGDQSAIERGVERGQFGLWAHFLSEFTDQDGQGSASGYDTDSYGAVVGASFGVADGISVGAFVGYQDLEQDFDISTVRSEGENTFFGVYANGSFGQLNAHASFAYHSSEVDTTRTLVNPGATARATYDVDAYVFSGRVGYNLLAPGRYGFEPYVGLIYINSDRDDVVERGAAEVNLEVTGGSTNLTFLDLGTKLSGQWFGGRLDGHLNAGWRYDLSGEDNIISARFAGQNTSFSVNGTDVERSRAVIGAGLLGHISENFAAYATYDGEFGSDISSHGFRAGVRYSF